MVEGTRGRTYYFERSQVSRRAQCGGKEKDAGGIPPAAPAFRFGLVSLACLVPEAVSTGSSRGGEGKVRTPIVDEPCERQKRQSQENDADRRKEETVRCR